MGKVVNLNKFRKKKLKAEATKRADTNRRLHGRTNTERERERLQKKKRETLLDWAFLTPPKDTPED